MSEDVRDFFCTLAIGAGLTCLGYGLYNHWEDSIVNGIFLVLSPILISWRMNA